MDNIERRDKELAYISDKAVMDEQAKCRRILQKLNFMDRSDFNGISVVVKQLLGRSEDSSFKATFTNMELTECRWLAHDGQQPD